MGSDWRDGMRGYIFMKNKEDVTVYTIDGRSLNTTSANNCKLASENGYAFRNPELLNSETQFAVSNSGNEIFFSFES